MLLVLNDNFGAKLLPGTAGGLMLSFDNPLTILCYECLSITSWLCIISCNVKWFCDSSSSKNLLPLK